jgi:hypothetical protein
VHFRRVSYIRATSIQPCCQMSSSALNGFEFKLVGARDLNPGPHGPEIWALSSTETDFAGCEFISRTHR